MNDPVHRALIIEFHFQFRRVDIDIEPASVDVDTKDEKGKASFFKQVFVGLEYRVIQVTVDNEAVVEKNVLLRSRLSPYSGQPKKPMKPCRWAVVLKGKDLPGKRLAEDRPHSSAKVRRPEIENDL